MMENGRMINLKVKVVWCGKMAQPILETSIKESMMDLASTFGQAVRNLSEGGRKE